jgi:hypothetical protein
MALARALALFWITNACNRVPKTITVIALHGNMSHCNKTNIMLGKVSFPAKAASLGSN